MCNLNNFDLTMRLNAGNWMQIQFYTMSLHSKKKNVNVNPYYHVCIHSQRSMRQMMGR